MNGFLVLGRATIDDIPLGLFMRREDAAAFAANVDVAYVRKVAHDVMGLDVSEVHAVGIVEFKGGEPTRLQIVTPANLAD